MAKINWKGGTMLSPVPAVLVSVGDMENSNLITIGWCGIISSDPPRLYISVRPERFSHHILMEKKEFCVNLTTGAMVRSVDICGVKSGKDVDKFKICKLTKEPGEKVSCPRVGESPISLECKVFDVVKMGSHDMFMADIVSVGVDESLLDEDGKLSLSRSGLIAYSHGSYMKLGAKLGSFGYSVKKKAPKKAVGKYEKRYPKNKAN